MIFFKEKTVTLGRCSADMQEWLCEQMMNWMRKRGAEHVYYDNNEIHFHGPSIPVNWKYFYWIDKGIIRFERTQNNVSITGQFVPNANCKYGFLAPLSVIIFSCFMGGYGTVFLVFLFGAVFLYALKYWPDQKRIIRFIKRLIEAREKHGIMDWTKVK